MMWVTEDVTCHESKYIPAIPVPVFLPGFKQATALLAQGRAAGRTMPMTVSSQKDGVHDRWQPAHLSLGP